MARKFFKQKVSSIKGPRNPIKFLYDMEEITEEEAREIIDEFFVGDETPYAKKMKLEIWDHVLKGTSVTIDENTLSSNR